MKSFILGLLAGIALIILAGVIFVSSGAMPVATKGNPLPFEKRIAHTALHAAIGKAEDTPSPLAADEPNLLAGAKVYVEQCMLCHGGLDHLASPTARGLFPRPPQLFEKMGVTDDSVGETFWKVKNGIRLTGMPGYEQSLTDTEMWQVTQLLKSAHELPESAKQVLSIKHSGEAKK